MNPFTSQSIYLRKIWHRIFAGSLVFCLILAALFFSMSQKEAYAFWGVGDTVLVVGGTGTIPQVAAAGELAVISGTAVTDTTKDNILDAIAWSVSKMMVQEMTADIVQWINSGFSGSPAFVTDVNGFLGDVADRVAGNYIYGSGLRFLCSPFKLDVQAALEITYRQGTSDSGTQCTFSGVMQNIETFGEAAQSWNDWFAVTTRPQNNQYGAFALAKGELNARITNTQGDEVSLLAQGGGFLGQKECTDVTDSAGNTTQRCITTTPGAVIKHQLDNHLDSGVAALITADELNEIISALFVQLARQALVGNGGLLGLSESGSAYLERVRAGEGDMVGQPGNYNPVRDQLAREREAQSVRIMIESLLGAREADQEGTCLILLSDAQQDVLDSVRVAITDGENSIAILTDLDARLNVATTSTEKNIIFTEYNDLASATTLSNEGSVIDLMSQYDDLAESLGSTIPNLKDGCDFRNANTNPYADLLEVMIYDRNGARDTVNLILPYEAKETAWFKAGDSCAHLATASVKDEYHPAYPYSGYWTYKDAILPTDSRLQYLIDTRESGQNALPTQNKRLTMMAKIYLQYSRANTTTELEAAQAELRKFLIGTLYGDNSLNKILGYGDAWQRRYSTSRSYINQLQADYDQCSGS